MCRVGCPVGSVFGSHVQSLFPQLPSEGVLEAAEHKHHPFHDPLEWDLRRALGFSFLLFGFRFGFGLALPLLVRRLLNWGSWRDNCYNIRKFSRWRTNLCANIQTLSITFCSAGAWRAGWARLVFGGCSFALRWARWAYFFCGWRAGGRLPLFAELKFSFCRWLWGKN